MFKFYSQTPEYYTEIGELTNSLAINKMSIFNKKQKVILEEYCREFYDKNILNPTIANLDVSVPTAEVFKKSIVEVEPSFSNINTQTFLYEIILLRFELFGLAFLHKLGDKNTASQTQFTRDYLREKNKEDIWEELEQYNQAIAASSRLNQTTETKKGRAYLVFLDGVRMNLFDLWYKKGFDSKCVARAANRVMTDEAWKNKLTHTYLMLTFCKRLGREINEEAQFRIMAMISGFYNGSIDSLKNISIA